MVGLTCHICPNFVKSAPRSKRVPPTNCANLTRYAYHITLGCVALWASCVAGAASRAGLGVKLLPRRLCGEALRRR